MKGEKVKGEGGEDRKREEKGKAKEIFPFLSFFLSCLFIGLKIRGCFFFFFFLFLLCLCSYSFFFFFSCSC